MAASAATKTHKISSKLKEIRSEKNNFYDFDRKNSKRLFGKGRLDEFEGIMESSRFIMEIWNEEFKTCNFFLFL